MVAHIKYASYWPLDGHQLSAGISRQTARGNRNRSAFPNNNENRVLRRIQRRFMQNLSPVLMMVTVILSFLWIVRNQPPYIRNTVGLHESLCRYRLPSEVHSDNLAKDAQQSSACHMPKDIVVFQYLFLSDLICRCVCVVSCEIWRHGRQSVCKIGGVSDRRHMYIWSRSNGIGLERGAEPREHFKIDIRANAIFDVFLCLFERLVTTTRKQLSVIR